MSKLLDFEDLFYTDSGIQSDVRDLYKSFDALYQSNKNNAYITNEYKAFKLFADDILKNGAKSFGSGTAVDNWRKRYSIAYGKVQVKSGPDPQAYGQPSYNFDLMKSLGSIGNPIYVGIGAGLLGVILLKYLLK